jgi:MFS family permease
MVASSHDLPSGRDNSSFAYPVLLALGALDAAGYSVIAPVAPEIAKATGATPGSMGVLVAMFPLGIVVGFMIAAAGIRRDRMQHVLLGSLALLAGGAIAMATSGSYGGYVVARFAMGLGSGGVWMGVTFNTLARWPGQEYLCMSRIFAAYSVGGLLGPALGALSGVSAPFLAYAAVVLIAIPAVMAMGPVRTARHFSADRSALRLPGFWLSCAGILFAVLALGLLEGVMPLHLTTELPQRGIAIVYASMSVVVAAAAALAARFRPRRALRAATVFVAAGISVVGLAGGIGWWLPALAIAGLGIGLANTGSIGVLLEAVPTDRIVTAMVLWSQVGIVGYLVGPLAGGFVVQAFGYGALGLVVLAASLPVLLRRLR